MTGPAQATVKRLFAVSGNRCAFPGCPNRLVHPSGQVIGEICHIEAHNSAGIPAGPPRSPSAGSAQRQVFPNISSEPALGDPRRSSTSYHLEKPCNFLESLQPAKTARASARADTLNPLQRA